MSEALLPGASSPGGTPGKDLRVRVEALRAHGAALFDPVGFRVIEAMLRRLDGCEGAAQTVLMRKIERRLAALRERFGRAGGEARATAPARPERGSLADLLAHVASHAAVPVASSASAVAGAGAAPSTELKALHHFRSTWSRLSLEQQLSRALAQAPDNAGPLNSHFLVLQALMRMRDIAPSYLEGVVAHAQALLWLEQADGGRGVASRGAGQKAAARKGDARPQGGRGRKRGG
ncbi:DUF2894 domain-containing protein [Thauera sp.]|jgi:hypothetical protein|uniref:DUF2894 domain-containing protein n=1 Tax=Thauera sp. TaxID=1905334 RepID=UPI002A3709A2|nr:DUF2894 domain-containing protein [Thauera sp.]MDX9886017.1 DUF2894 domain-containing protein [Thauera sp.]